MTTAFEYGRYAKSLAIDVREFLENVSDGERDFTVNDYRFIREDAIDEVMQEELASDEYLLGCFNAWFLSDILGISQDVIEAMQKAEAFDAIGKLVIDLDKLEQLQTAYASADGYGHHFNTWDGSEDQIGEYYVFRT